MDRNGLPWRLWIPAMLLASSFTTIARGELVVNGGFETQDARGWTEWGAPWSNELFFDYASQDDPYEGDASFHMSTSRGSFGVYQELCVEPGAPAVVEWAWRGLTSGNGWWEVLIVDGTYSYEAVDDPLNHPETLFASKWEVGFGGPYPEPSEAWLNESAELIPQSDVITLVLKCGSSEGGSVEAWFDDVLVEHDTNLLEVHTIDPSTGGTAGGEEVRVLGRVFPEGTTVTLGGVALEGIVRRSSCEVAGSAPPGEAGTVDVVVTTPSGEVVTVIGGYAYGATLDPRFLRGDCTGDGDLNITDGIAVLNFLFLGSAAPPCQEACNISNDADLNVSDSVGLLNFLFLGGPQPAEPYPECGTDPGGEGSCASPHAGCP